jgi:uncharacterized cupredoxin-like copper-binding protein
MLRATILASLGAALAWTGALAHEGANPAGEVGDASKPSRTIEIVMNEADGAMGFTPSLVTVARGEQVRFVIQNAGSLDHEFFLGDAEANRSHAAKMAAMPDMKHDDSNAKSVAPGGTATLTWRFSNAGEFEFACLIPGHYQAGMHGVVTVK